MPVAIPYNPVPSVNPDNRGIGYLSVPNATPEAFGAGVGRALQGLGQGFSSAGDDLFRYSMQMQTQVNEAGARDVTAQGIAKLSTIRANYEAEQGRNAIDAYPQYQKDLAEARQQLLESAQNPAQRRMIDSEISRSYAWALSGGATHFAGQSRQYDKQQRQAVVTAQEQDAAAAGSYDEWKSKADALVANSRRDAAETAGLPPEALDMLGKTARTKSFADWIKLQADADPQAAYATFEKEKDSLVPSAAITIGNYLRGQVKQKASVTIADQAARGMPIEAPHWGAATNSLAPQGKPGGQLTRDQVFTLAMREVQQQGLVGTVPIDGPKYGINTGSAEEWASLLTKISNAESGHNNADNFREPGMVDATGRQVYSRGLYSLSEQDGPTYGLNGGARFTTQQLADPNINTAAAVSIVKSLIASGGRVANLGKYWSTLRDGTIFKLGEGTGEASTTAQNVTAAQQNFDAQMQHSLAAYPLMLKTGATLPALTPGMSEADFLAMRQELEAHLRNDVFKGPMDQDIIDKTMANYDARFQRMQQQYKAQQGEIGKGLLAYVNGYGSMIGEPDAKPMIALDELLANPKAKQLYDSASPSIRGAIDAQLRRNQQTDERGMTDEAAMLAGTLAGKIRNGEYVDPALIIDSGISSTKQRELLVALGNRSQDPVTSTKMFTDFFPPLMESAFGIKRGSDAYNYIFSQVHDALGQAKPDGKAMDPASMQAVVQSKLAELHTEHPELFSAVSAANATMAPAVQQHLNSVIKNKGQRDAAVDGIQQAGAVIGAARLLPPQMKLDMQRALIDTKVSVSGFWGYSQVPLANAYAKLEGQPSPLVAAGIQPGVAQQIIKDFTTTARRAPTVDEMVKLFRHNPAYLAMNKRMFNGVSNGQ